MNADATAGVREALEAICSEFAQQHPLIIAGRKALSAMPARMGREALRAKIAETFAQHAHHPFLDKWTAADAILALSPIEATEAEGWRLVPVEPTLAMFRALMERWTGTEAGKLATAQWALGTFAEDYRAMLAAAPTPPVPDRTAPK